MIETVCGASAAAGPISCGACSLAAMVAEKMLAAASTTQREAVKGMMSPRCYSETGYPASSWMLLLLATRTLVNSLVATLRRQTTAPTLDLRKLTDCPAPSSAAGVSVAIVFQL